MSTTAKVKSKGRKTGPRMLVIETLERVGGVIEDADGGATRKLHEELGREISEKSLANGLKKMEELGLIQRTVRGKRTYEIRLPNDQGQGASGPSDNGREQHGSDDGGLGRGLVGNRTRGGDLAPGKDAGLLQDVDYGRLAVELLNHASEVIANGTAEGVDEIKRRLGDALEDAQRVKRRLVEVGEELHAVKVERDGLRKQKAMLERNVEALMKAEVGTREADHRRRAVEQMMSERPRAK